MRFLITGAKGQLGYDVKKELLSRGYTDILAIDYDELDITKRTDVLDYFVDHEPDVVFHCAAYTNVNKAEEEKDKCYNVNVIGTRNIVESCMLNKTKQAKLIYLSTDYVFDGTKDGIYEIDDTTNPLSYYGETKHLGELEASKLDSYFIVRISWVFGINGSNFVKSMLDLSSKKDELSIVSDQVGSPTYTVDLAKLLVDMSLTDKYGIYHATNEGYCSWYEFAQAIFEINDIKIKLNPITSDKYPTTAVRPLNSRLSKSNLDENGFNRLPTWEDALNRYNLELREEASKTLIRK